MPKLILALAAAALAWLSIESAFAQSTRSCNTTYDSRGRVVSKNCY